MTTLAQVLDGMPLIDRIRYFTLAPRPPEDQLEQHMHKALALKAYADKLFAAGNNLKAYKYMWRSANLGYTKAMLQLGYWHHDGLPEVLEPDRITALYWLRRAGLGGERHANLKLDAIYNSSATYSGRAKTIVEIGRYTRSRQHIN